MNVPAETIVDEYDARHISIVIYADGTVRVFEAGVSLYPDIAAAVAEIEGFVHIGRKADKRPWWLNHIEEAYQWLLKRQ